jgi:serine/threonine protein kinase
MLDAFDAFDALDALVPVVHFVKSMYYMTKGYVEYVTGYAPYETVVKNTLSDLSRLNILYTKILQWTAELSPEQEGLNQFIRSFTDQVPYTNTDIDQSALDEMIELARFKGDTLTLDSKTPMNAGSIALVFKAHLNGKPVVIKIQRVNIIARLTESIRLFVLLGKMLQFVPYVWNIDVLSIFTRNIQTLMKQTDFLQEMKNIQQFYTSYKGDKTIVIPQVYPYFTENNRQVLVMDFIEGKTVYQLTAEERALYSKKLSQCTFSSYLVKGLYHGDLHPGNVLFLPGNKIGYIDFGMIVSLSVPEQDFLFDFFKNFANGDYTHLLEDFFTDEACKTCLKISKASEDPDQFQTKIHALKGQLNAMLKSGQLFKKGGITHYDIYLMISELKKVDLEFNDFTAFNLLASITVLSLNFKLDPNFQKDLQGEFTKFMDKITFAF